MFNRAAIKYQKTKKQEHQCQPPPPPPPQKKQKKQKHMNKKLYCILTNYHCRSLFLIILHVNILLFHWILYRLRYRTLIYTYKK